VADTDELATLWTGTAAEARPASAGLVGAKLAGESETPDKARLEEPSIVVVRFISGRDEGLATQARSGDRATRISGLAHEATISSTQ
jgi:hypothetical protein